MLPPPPPSGHSQLMGNFMGAAQRSAAGNMPEPSARRTWGCRAALTSARQTICRSRCRTLPSPRGCGCVTPGLSTPTNTQHLGGVPCMELGAQPESKGTLQRPGNLTAGVTPPKFPLGIQAWHSGSKHPCSLLAPRAPRSGATSHAAIPPCPLARIWRAGCAHRAHGSRARRCLALSPPARSTAWHGGQRCRCGSRSRPEPGWLPAGPWEWLAPVSLGLINIHSA